MFGAKLQFRYDFRIVDFVVIYEADSLFTHKSINSSVPMTAIIVRNRLHSLLSGILIVKLPVLPGRLVRYLQADNIKMLEIILLKIRGMST